MGFEYYEPQATEAPRRVATVRFLSGGRVHFNAAAGRLLDGVTHLRLAFDNDTYRVGFEPTDASDTFGYKLTFAPSQVVLTAPGFAHRYGIDPQKLAVEVDGEMFVAQVLSVTKDGPLE